MNYYHKKYVELAREIILNLVDKENTSVFLFGSRTGLNYKHDSDIDIGFLANHKLDNKLFNKISEALEDSIVPYHIDLVDFTNVDKEFKKIALGEIEIWNKAPNSNIN